MTLWTPVDDRPSGKDLFCILYQDPSIYEAY